MGRAVLQACLPWLALLAVSFLVAYLLVRMSQSRVRFSRLRSLHGDQRGGVQSLAFVLVLPFFIMVMLFIVQVSQLMIGTMVVHYAAYAGARSAMVWIPAAMSAAEGANCISTYYLDPDAPDQRMPILDPDDPSYGPTDGGVTCVVEPGSPKYNRVASAAVLACMSICPSRDTGGAPAGDATLSAGIIKAAYASLVADSAGNPKIAARLENKLAYAAQNTEVEIRFYHKNREPPLVTYFLPYDITEFRHNELGWQDTITVSVKHDFALLPGPGRFLSKFVPGANGEDKVSSRIENKGNVYVYPLRASATLGNEGDKSVVPYEYQTF